MDSEEAYRRIFEKKSFSSFLRDPSSLLPYMTEYGMGKDEVSSVGLLISASKDLFVDSISNQDSVKAQRSLVSLSDGFLKVLTTMKQAHFNNSENVMDFELDLV